ncbi:hypothetical protein CGCSCA5_v013425 [Colletotrichum siamense]|nr:hypothetical protein CGCSCA5_v013425 [Colletotrichum siamense]
MDFEKYHELIPEGRCAKCRKIPWRYSEWFANRSSFKIEHHESWTALEEAASAVCDLCRSLRVLALRHIDADMPKAVPCLLRIELVYSEIEPLELKYAIGNKKEHEFVFGIETADGLDIPDESMGGIKRLGPETQDSDLNALIRNRIDPWTEDCLHQRGRHTNCKPVSIRGQETFHLPTRLIDVGNRNAPLAQLVETKDLLSIKPKPEYLALSYCWGQSNEPAKITRTNFQARKQRLEEWNFPKTIRDAIHLTRLMGIRYLWVDAVCIIQPSSQDQDLTDWEKEAPMMASYYSNARCLFSALAASDSGQGIFTERRAQKYPRKNSPIKFTYQPLLTRGWCFQERVLSLRALHWSANCLYWQCQSLTEASEQDPNEELPRAYPAVARDEPQIFQREAEFALTSSWLRAVVAYMRTDFTYLTDRLIAIESLGTRLAKIHGAEYFAGVFSSDLTRGLLWRLTGDLETSQKLSYFPSWSWASSTNSGPVFFEHEQDDEFKSLTGVGGHGEVFPSAGSAMDFDTPEKRSLRLEAPLLEANPAKVRVEFDDPYGTRSSKFIDESSDAEVEMIFDAAHFVPQEFGPTKLLFLSVTEQQTEIAMFGLIVRPQEGYYERVGYVSFTMPLELSAGPTKLAELMARLEENRSHVILI